MVKVEAAVAAVAVPGAVALPVVGDLTQIPEVTIVVGTQDVVVLLLSGVVTKDAVVPLSGVAIEDVEVVRSEVKVVRSGVNVVKDEVLPEVLEDLHMVGLEHNRQGMSHMIKHF